MKITADFVNVYNFNASMNEDDNFFDFDMGESQIYTENNHDKLINRDAENQHPINSITGLSHELQKLDSKVNVNDSSYWADKQDYVPTFGELIIITDYGTDETNEMFIGDGETKISELKSAISPIAKKLSHTLTIGKYIFDGSEDVSVEIYDGTIKDEYGIEALEIKNEMRLIKSDKEVTELRMVNETEVIRDVSKNDTMTLL